ncbi:hypothetical protein RMSM_05666 [Rhodopirellula maiorica SM1]|uniref:Uncharacterized protein n=1 Tax=Rhodopirellula maiorica SM1 TaxID=1265738 RepID=M5RPX3_9BACT|nr:hypothetical protein RMSM_05666 [Rhodopirellula maiorica SM1]
MTCQTTLEGIQPLYLPTQRLFVSQIGRSPLGPVLFGMSLTAELPCQPKDRSTATTTPR